MAGNGVVNISVETESADIKTEDQAMFDTLRITVKNEKLANWISSCCITPTEENIIGQEKMEQTPSSCKL